MSILFTYKDQEIWSLATPAMKLFLGITRMVEAEVGGISAGFSPIVSDEIVIDRERFISFVDGFFRQAERNGSFRLVVGWAQEIAGMYENLTGTKPVRKMSGVWDFEPIGYTPGWMNGPNVDNR